MCGPQDFVRTFFTMAALLRRQDSPSCKSQRKARMKRRKRGKTNERGSLWAAQELLALLSSPFCVPFTSVAIFSQEQETLANLSSLAKEEALPLGPDPAGEEAAEGNVAEKF